MSPRSAGRAPWLLVPFVLLTLSSVTLLVPRRAVQAAPKPARAAAPAAAPAAYDDGDGDELLEHWSNPVVGHEATLQLTGILAGFVVLGAGVVRRRVRRPRQGVIAAQMEMTAQMEMAEHRKAA